MTRVTYHCPNCGDPDAPDANHAVTADGSFYWRPETQSWEAGDVNGCDLWCSECGELGSPGSLEVELPDLSPAEVLAIARRRARDLEHQTAAAWKAVREAEAEVEARQAAFEAEAARAKRIRDAAPELLALLQSVEQDWTKALDHDGPVRSEEAYDFLWSFAARARELVSKVTA